MILVDSSVWIGLFRGDSNPQTKLMLSILQSGDEELAIADIILPEVLQGFRSEKQAHTALQAIEGLPALHWAANLWLFWRPPTIASCVKKKRYYGSFYHRLPYCDILRREWISSAAQRPRLRPF